MALRRSVMKEGYILCKLYANTLSDVSDNGENEILNSDNDVPIASSRKQLWPAVVFTSDSETVQKRQEVVNWRAVMIKQVTCGVKLIKNQAVSLFLEPQGWI